MSQRCTAINSKGELCRVFALIGSDPPRCLWHAPRGMTNGAPAAPLTVEEEIAGLTSEYRRLLRSRKKTEETARLILALREAIRELSGLAPASEPAKKDDPEWMRKFRR